MSWVQVDHGCYKSSTHQIDDQGRCEDGDTSNYLSQRHALMIMISSTWQMFGSITYLAPDDSGEYLWAVLETDVVSSRDHHAAWWQHYNKWPCHDSHLWGPHWAGWEATLGRWSHTPHPPLLRWRRTQAEAIWRYQAYMDKAVCHSEQGGNFPCNVVKCPRSLWSLILKKSLNLSLL